MTPRRPYASELFARAGAALYGEAWQSPLAHALGVNLRTVQRIAAAAAAGEPYRISPALMNAVAMIVRQHEGELRTVWMEIKKGWGD